MQALAATPAPMMWIQSSCIECTVFCAPTEASNFPNMVRFHGDPHVKRIEEYLHFRLHCY